MPDDQGNETQEEAEARIAQVRATQIFGDTPTDPTIGDVVVPAHDEEGANVAAASVAEQAEDDEDGDAADVSQEEAKRQLEPLSAEDVEEDPSTRDESTLSKVFGGDDDNSNDDDNAEVSDSKEKKPARGSRRASKK